MTTPEPAIIALQERVERFLATGDHAFLTSPQAHADREAVERASVERTASGETRISVLAFQALGAFLHLQGDLAMALRYYGLLYSQGEEFVSEAGRRLVLDVSQNVLRFADASMERFDDTGDVRHADEAIGGFRQILAWMPDGAPAVPICLSRLGNALHRRYGRSGDHADLRGAVQARRGAAALTPLGAQERALRLSTLSLGLLEVHAVTGELAALQEAVECLEESVARTPADSPYHILRRVNLASALVERFAAVGEETDLERAVALGREVLAQTPADHEDYDLAVRTQAEALKARYDHTADVTDLDEHVAVRRAALAAGPSAAGHDSLSSALCHRYERTGNPADLDESIEHGRAAIAFDTDPRLGRLLSNHCYGLRLRYERSANYDDLSEAVTVGRRALAIMNRRDPAWFMAASNLLRADLASYDSQRNLRELDEALSLYHDIMDDTPADHPDRGLRLAEYLDAALKRFEHTGKQEDLGTTLAIARSALDAPAPQDIRIAEILTDLAGHLPMSWGLRRGVRPRARLEGDRERLAAVTADDRLAKSVDLLISFAKEIAERSPGQARCTAFLGSAVLARYRLSRTASDGDEGVRLLQEAVAVAASTGSERASHLANLGASRLVRFLNGQDEADLDTGVRSLEEARRLSDPSSRAHGAHLLKLISGLQYRYELLGASQDVQRVADLAREVATTGRYYVPLVVQAMLWVFGVTGDPRAMDDIVDIDEIAVADTLLSHYREIGGIAVLDRVVALYERKLEEDTSQRGHLLYHLAITLRMRAVRTVNPGDLDRAIALFRQALKLSDPQDPWRAAELTGLGVALRARYERAYDDQDLRASLHAHEEARRISVSDPVLRANIGIAAANALRVYCERTGDRDTLDEAINLARSSVEALLVTDADIWSAYSVLAALLGSRVSLFTPAPGDADELVRVARRMVDGAGRNDPERAVYLLSLARAHYWRCELTGDRNDLDEGIRRAQEGVDSCPAGDPQRTECLHQLARMTRHRYRLTGDPTDRGLALESWRAATRILGGSPRIRAWSAGNWARLAAEKGDVAEAVEAFDLAVRLVPVIAWHGLSLAARRENLIEWPGLAAEAATCAILAGQPATAVELLEQGRSVLWQQLLELRGDLTELARSHPGLAAEVESLRTALNSGVHDLNGDLNEDLREERRGLALEWDRVVGEVRELNGFRHFLAPTPYDELRRAAGEGPIIIVNASRYGCHALVVRADRPVPEVIDLPRLTSADVYAHAGRLMSSIIARPRTFLERERRRHVIHDTLDWLWDAVTGPVLEALAPRPGQRVWWCPVDLLSFLPLHAAGHHPRHRTDAGTDGWALDRVVSSYTPTLGALLRSRERLAWPAPYRQLAVGLPRTPGLADLTGVESELAAISRVEPPARLLIGDAATREAVLAALPEHSRAHFACHAFQDFREPDRSALLLHDGPLTVAELASADLPGVELAYLSACESAAGAPVLADESIHLAAALQLIGYRHVLAAIWPLPDPAAAAVAGAFYERIGETSPAVALHRAVGELRAADPTDPSQWASYLHLGS
ncbi:CHAT domain-containing protein [Nonomuraea dietziae]|uniref:CHAT domain-containing protein n=1 Tax=Nonomuraea dietziae TaxID=65515 RepID=UPI0034196835